MPERRCDGCGQVVASRRRVRWEDVLGEVTRFALCPTCAKAHDRYVGPATYNDRTGR